jgi:hypothetical protein
MRVEIGGAHYFGMSRVERVNNELLANVSWTQRKISIPQSQVAFGNPLSEPPYHLLHKVGQ